MVDLWDGEMPDIKGIIDNIKTALQNYVNTAYGGVTDVFDNPQNIIMVKVVNKIRNKLEDLYTKMPSLPTSVREQIKSGIDTLTTWITANFDITEAQIRDWTSSSDLFEKFQEEAHDIWSSFT